ncbi:MAG: c-type cytochrome [Dehalococcoidales bacterium]
MKYILVLAFVLLPAAGWADIGEDLFKKNCASCHGVDGKAQTKMGKKLKVSDLVESNFNNAMTAVTGGVVNDTGKTVMKAYSEKLSAEEITAVIDYVQNEFIGVE